MRAHYDLRGGRPNDYAKRLGAEGREAILAQYVRAEGLVRLDDDVAAAFGSAEAVNEALRIVLRLRELAPPTKQKPTTKTKATTTKSTTTKRRRAAGG